MLLVAGARIARGCRRARACRSSATSSTSVGGPKACRFRPTPPSWKTVGVVPTCPGRSHRRRLRSRRPRDKNGTFIDDARAEGKVRLRDGALVFLGDHVAISVGIVDRARSDEGGAGLAAGPVPTASPGLAVACDRLRRLAASDGELLIVGETGVGKEVYARRCIRPAADLADSWPSTRGHSAGPRGKSALRYRAGATRPLIRPKLGSSKRRKGHAVPRRRSAR